MAYYTLRLQAGVPYTHNVTGKLILLDSTGDADGIDIATIRNGTPQTTMPMRKAAFRLVEAYDGVMLTSPVATSVGIFLSFEDVQLGVADGAAVKVPEGLVVKNLIDDPIPVTFSQQIVPLGSVDITNEVTVVGSVGISNDVSVVARGASTVTNGAPVAATDVESALLASNPARRGVRIYNAGPGAVAIGGAGLVYEHAAITIRPGETWNEADAPGAAWRVICEPGETASIKIQEIS